MDQPVASRNIPWAFLVFLMIVGLATLVLLAPYLLPIYFGWILSRVILPVHRWLLRHHWKPARSALVCTFGALFVIILPIGGFGFAFVRNLIRLINPYTNSGLDLQDWIDRVYDVPLAQHFFSDRGDLQQFVSDHSKTAIGGVANALTGLLGAAPAAVLAAALALLAIYFILVDGHRLRDWAGPRIPLPPETKARFLKGLNDIAYSSFLSVVAAAFAQSFVVFIGFLVLGVPMAWLAFGVAFVCAWFPIFGVTPVWVGAVLFLFASQETGKALGMVGFGVVASLIDNFVRPWVLKGRGDLHPLVSLVAIFGAILYFGIAGVFIGPVVVSFAIQVIDVWPMFAREIGLLSEPATIEKK